MRLFAACSPRHVRLKRTVFSAFRILVLERSYAKKRASSETRFLLCCALFGCCRTRLFLENAPRRKRIKTDVLTANRKHCGSLLFFLNSDYFQKEQHRRFEFGEQDGCSGGENGVGNDCGDDEIDDQRRDPFKTDQAANEVARRAGYSGKDGKQQQFKHIFSLLFIGEIMLE